MSKNVVINTTSAEDTMVLGERLGKVLSPAMVIALTGDLGAGKTTLTKGIAKGLGIDDTVHSPTFTLIHEHEGRIPLYHFDLYRLSEPQELEDIGYEEYFYSDAVTIIEWPEKVYEMLPQDHLEIRITGQDDDRTFEITATGPEAEEVLLRLER